MNLSQRLGRLSDEQRSQIYRSLIDAGHSFASLPIPDLTDFTELEIPLLATQQRILNLESQNPGARFNRVELTLVLEGEIDSDALAAAIRDVSMRHECLRCLFENSSASWHVRLSTDPVTLELIDLSSTHDPENELEGIRRKVAATDLLTGNLAPWRAVLAQLSPLRHVLIFEFHHVIVDGYALDIVASDTAWAYRARIAGGTPLWETIPPRLADYATFERDVVRSGRVKAGRLLADPTAIPPDLLILDTRPRTARTVTRLLSKEIWKDITSSAQLSAVTSGTMLTTIASLAISLLSGSRSVEFALAVSGRHHPSATLLVAPLVYNAAFTLEIDLDRDLQTLLKTASHEVLSSLEDGPLRAASPASCLVIIQNANPSLPDLPNLTISRLPALWPGAHHDIVICFVPEGDTWRLEVEYSCALFTEDRAESIADFVVQIARDLRKTDGRPLRECLAPNWQQASAWLGSEPEVSSGVELEFESLRLQLLRQADAKPDNPAIIASDGSVFSYKTVFYAALALSSQMVNAGSGIGMVALALDHGPQLVIAMLACVLSERPFVVLDLQTGSAHANAILSDSAATLLLSSRVLPQNFGENIEKLVFSSVSELENAGRPLVSDTRPASSSHSPVYIAYTSGSSGKPKGIVQSERSFVQFLSWQEPAFSLCDSSRVAMWSSPVFDACYTEVFGAFKAGGTLCIPEPTIRNDPQAVVKWLKAAGVTYLLTIPSFLSFVVDAASSAGTQLESLIDVATSGETLPPELAVRLHRVAPAARLTNLFGPTECVLASCYTVSVNHPANKRVSVGRPLKGRRIILVDNKRCPVQRGAVGEIAVISDYLTTGYTSGDPDHKFTFTREDERIYFTGDRGRIGADGLLYFEGREDERVKIRGMLVDLDGVARIVEQIPEISACQVVTVQIGTTKRLVAAVVSLEREISEVGPQIANAEMSKSCRDRVRNVLGDRAVPTAIILVQSFPRTATGKINRTALEEIGRKLLSNSTVTPHEECGLARSAYEDVITNAWAGLLGRPVSRDEPFFDAGGDSLMAVELHLALEKLLPGSFQLVDIYSNPTIAALTAKIVNDRGARNIVQKANKRAEKRNRLLTRKG